MINLIASAVPAPFDSVLVLSPGDIDASGWAPPIDLGTSGALSWGAYESGTGTVLGDSVTLGPDVMPYIVGATPVVTVPSGMLNYSLPTGTTMVAYGSSGSTGTLNTFDLGIDLGALVYTFDFDLTMLSDSYNANNLSGSLSSGSTSQDFSFTQFFMSGSTCAGGCDIDVAGFLAGPNAEQAGAAYLIRDQMGSSIISGAAPLTR